MYYTFSANSVLYRCNITSLRHISNNETLSSAFNMHTIYPWLIVIINKQFSISHSCPKTWYSFNYLACLHVWSRIHMITLTQNAQSNLVSIKILRLFFKFSSFFTLITEVSSSFLPLFSSDQRAWSLSSRANSAHAHSSRIDGECVRYAHLKCVRKAHCERFVKKVGSLEKCSRTPRTDSLTTLTRVPVYLIVQSRTVARSISRVIAHFICNLMLMRGEKKP